jgi:hypothetical protein
MRGSIPIDVCANPLGSVCAVSPGLSYYDLDLCCRGALCSVRDLSSRTSHYRGFDASGPGLFWFFLPPPGLLISVDGGAMRGLNVCLATRIAGPLGDDGVFAPRFSCHAFLSTHASPAMDASVIYDLSCRGFCPSSDPRLSQVGRHGKLVRLSPAPVVRGLDFPMEWAGLVQPPEQFLPPF